MRSMLKKVMFHINRFKPYLFVLVVFLIVLIYMLITMFYNNREYKQMIINNYSSILNVVFAENENTVKNIAAIVNQFASNTDTMSFLNTSASHSDLEIVRCIAVLSNLKNTYQWIDDITILNRSDDTVVSTTGYYPASDFYSTNYQYEEYSLSYWKQYLNPLSPFQILPPSTVTTSNKSLSVIPIVFTQIAGIRMTNLLIINIDIGKMTASMRDYKITDASEFYILNNQSGTTFPEFPISDQLLREAISAAQKPNTEIDTFDLHIDGQEPLLMLSYSPNKSILGYTYMVSIPYSEINKSFQHPTLIMLGIGLLFLCILLAVAYRNAKIYNMPVESIKSLLQTSGIHKPHVEKESPQDLPLLINQIIDSNILLKKEHQMVVPLLQEKILIDYLNSTDIYIDPDAKAHLDGILETFPYTYFVSVIINIRFTPVFYQIYTEDDSKNIRLGIVELIEAMFAQKYKAYILPADQRALYVLLNTDNPDCAADISALIHDLTDSFFYDNDLIHLQIGMGSVCKDLIGLRQTHLEALESINEITSFSDIKINIKRDITQTQKLRFSTADENKFYTALMVGNAERATEIFTELVKSNIERGVGKDNMLQLYIQIISCLFKAMRAKNIPYCNNDQHDWDLISDMLLKTSNEIVEYILAMIQTASQKPEQYRSKASIEEIIQYIDDHYTEPLGLEQISDTFGITPKYLSLKIKSHLNITFHEYLSNMRIEKSKQLLLTTNKKISEIYESVGFNNRNTFIRTFKAKVGMMPSEFRAAKNT